MIDRIDEIFALPPHEQPDQCQVGLRHLRELVMALNPTAYMEIGCAKLLTFSVFHRLLRDPAIAIGVDIREYPEWSLYQGNAHLFSGGSTNPEVIEGVKNALGDHKLDVLFIDGNHDFEYVQADWDNFSPLVRKGGLVIFHDWDPPAVIAGKTKGQGAALVCNRLQLQGHRIYNVPQTAIGTAYLYI